MARLGDVCTIYTGTGFPTQYQGNEEGKYPFYKVGDISRNASAGNRILNLCDNFVDYDVVKAIKGTLIPAGTVVFAKIGEAVKLNRRAITGCECLVDNNAMGIKPNEQHVLLDYFFHFVSNVHMETLAEATTVPSVKKSAIEKIEIPVPPINEQSRIATELNQVDALISLRKQQIAKLDELVKARFVEMFETGQWSTVKASNFMSNMRNGVSPSNSGTISAKVLTLSAITQATFDKDAWKDGIFDIEPSEDKRISSCDFYMCRGNGNKNLVGSGVYSHENYYDLVFPDTVIAAQIDTSQVMLPFLFHAWKRPSVRSQIEAGARTTNGTYKINQKVIASVEIVHPPLDLQHQFAVFVAQTDQQKLTIQHSLAQLELLKKALMQKYFG